MKIVVAINLQNDIINKCQGSKVIINNIINFIKNNIDNSEYEFLATRYSNYIENLSTLPYKDYLELLKNKIPLTCRFGLSGWELIDDIKKLIPVERVFNTHNDFIGELNQNITSILINKDKTLLDVDEIILFGFYTGFGVLIPALFLKNKYPNIKITVFENFCFDEESDHRQAIELLKKQQINISSYA